MEETSYLLLATMLLAKSAEWYILLYIWLRYLRHYKKKAVDLWQGDPATFHGDLLCEDLQDGLPRASRSSLRHLVFFPDLSHETDEKLEDYAQETMQKIKNFCDDTPEDSFPKRITVVLKEENQYRLFQEKLFRVFPEKSR